MLSYTTAGVSISKAMFRLCQCEITKTTKLSIGLWYFSSCWRHDRRCASCLPPMPLPADVSVRVLQSRRGHPSSWIRFRGPISLIEACVFPYILGRIFPTDFQLLPRNTIAATKWKNPIANRKKPRNTVRNREAAQTAFLFPTSLSRLKV